MKPAMQISNATLYFFSNLPLSKVRVVFLISSYYLKIR